MYFKLFLTYISIICQVPAKLPGKMLTCCLAVFDNFAKIVPVMLYNT